MHHFTIDIEEYFQVVALDAHVPRDSWTTMESRIHGAVDELLALLSSSGARATCFTLGWIADRYPELVRALAAAGHEIASHGWDHVRVTQQSAAAFRDSVRRAKEVLEDITGEAVLGFRAPSFSIVPGLEWAFDILLEEGYRYDSSLFPVRRPDGYGYAHSQRDPHILARQAGAILELPMTTFRIARLNIPAAGGGYFRLLPYALAQAALRSCERRGAPGMFYIHPWELDPGQPRFAVSTLTRVRHYGGLSRTHDRLRRLLAEFRFRSVREYLRDLDGGRLTLVPHVPRGPRPQGAVLSAAMSGS